MKSVTRFLGLDVHADTISAAAAEDGRDGEVRSLGVIANEPGAIRRLAQKLGKKGLRACYEAGPTGYTLYWQLKELGIPCEVIAPTLIPKKPGDRIKTDRRDALHLARCFRAGELVKVWVPDQAHEALRDLVRAREAAQQDQHRARQRLGKFLLRLGRRAPKKGKSWSTAQVEWIRAQKFEHVAQQATMIDYLSEVDHAGERILRLEQAIDDAIKVASPTVKAVIEGLQALRGIAKLPRRHLLSRSAASLASIIRRSWRPTAERCPASTRAENNGALARSRRAATPMCDVCSSRLRGVTDTGPT